MVAQPNRLRMSIESYVTLDRNSTDARYEFIDGYAYVMSGGTANHNTISINSGITVLAQLSKNMSSSIHNVRSLRSIDVPGPTGGRFTFLRQALTLK